MKQLKDVFGTLRNMTPSTLVVAGAADTVVLEAVSAARREGFVGGGILVGSKEDISREAAGKGIDISGFEIFHEPEPGKIPRTATGLISGGKADIMMKGLVQTPDLLRAVLDPAAGFRKEGSIISSIAVVEVPQWDRFLFITDVGFIPAPDLKTKAALIRNAVTVARKLGVEIPKVGVLCAAETVNPKIPSMVDARELEEMNRRGEIADCLVAGPISLDLAISPESAAHKGYSHPVAGKADILIMPSLETGNALVKSLGYFAKFEIAGVTAGTGIPMVFTSRADSTQTKLYTIAMTAYLAQTD
jgi:phosphate butyryltransferase